MMEADVKARVYARGFLLSQETTRDISKKLSGCPYQGNLAGWTHTFFGPCTLWVDPLLNYERAVAGRFAVGLMGLCINPVDGLSNNQDIAAAALTNLHKGRNSFFDYIDQLSGSFVVIYRDNANVFILQDAAATKPVYYHHSAQGHMTVSTHAKIVQHLYDLKPDPRAEKVYNSDIYKKDPSPYLPGMITPFTNLLPLTANHELDISQARSLRFFPREPLAPRPFDDIIVDEIAEFMVAQARIIGSMQRPLRLAATGGRDSRVSAATFSGQPNLSYYSFHRPTTNHMTDDVIVAQKIADAEGVELSVYELEEYVVPHFDDMISAHSPRKIWPAAAVCYMREFDPHAIHIRSAVSEVGRVFHSKRPAKTVTAEALATAFTLTSFNNDPMLIETMRDFITLTDFDTSQFHGYDLYDMFYWEHRLAKWQNILCLEAEMATDVFIPFSNRDLLKKFLSVPTKNRAKADIHVAICNKLKPEFRNVEFV